MSKHYDVAILGAGVGALTAAALLARRSWRVLVLGQGWRPPTYQYDGVTLARRPFAFLAGSSPAWSRVLVELAQSQTFRRRTLALDPMFQVLARRLRLEVPPEVQLFGKEIDRVFPEVRRISATATPPARCTRSKMGARGHARSSTKPMPSGRTRGRLPGIPPPVMWLIARTSTPAARTACTARG